MAAPASWGGGEWGQDIFRGQDPKKIHGFDHFKGVRPSKTYRFWPLCTGKCPFCSDLIVIVSDKPSLSTEKPGFSPINLVFQFDCHSLFAFVFVLFFDKLGFSNLIDLICRLFVCMFVFLTTFIGRETWFSPINMLFFSIRMS